MALLCGCDYCPDGIEGIGKDAVMKLFQKYKNNEILERIQSWRDNDTKYTSLEMRVEDKNVCSNCGHMGKLLSHTKSGCPVCKMSKGCDSSLWKDERLAIKSELSIRKKALADMNFPSQEIIKEFKSIPSRLPDLELKWKQPNLVKFIRVFGNLLQWTEIYSFQKFLPLLTRWQVFYYKTQKASAGIVHPDYIKKKRAPKGISSYEIIWKDYEKCFECLIPDEQKKSFISSNPKGVEVLWSTIEPVDLVEKTYPDLVQNFLSKQKKPKTTKKKTENKSKKTKKTKSQNDSLNDLSGLLAVANELEKGIVKKRSKNHLIDKYLIKLQNTPPSKKENSFLFNKCSTPNASILLSDFENDDENDFDFSNIIRGIVSKSPALREYQGKKIEI